ncbi:hypothetical protein HDU76_011396, partial [Blyttiomyces sp. JEL0837]
MATSSTAPTATVFQGRTLLELDHFIQFSLNRSFREKKIVHLGEMVREMPVEPVKPPYLAIEDENTSATKIIEINQANESIDKAFGEKYKNWEQAYKVYTSWLRDTEEGKEVIQKAFPASTIERIGGVDKYPNIAQLITAIRNYYNGGIENGSVYTHLMGRLTDDFRKVFTKKTWDADEVLLYMLAGAISGPGFGNVHFGPFMQDFHQNGVKAYKSADDFLQAIIQRETTMRANTTVGTKSGANSAKAAVGKAGGKGKGTKAANAEATKGTKKLFCRKHRWNNSHKTSDCTKLKKEMAEKGESSELTSVKDVGVDVLADSGA